MNYSQIIPKKSGLWLINCATSNQISQCRTLMVILGINISLFWFQFQTTSNQDYTR